MPKTTAALARRCGPALRGADRGGRQGAGGGGGLRCYEKLKQDAQCVDFGDLVSLPVRLLQADAAVREHLQRAYDHVLVDEYQDVNRSSVRF